MSTSMLPARLRGRGPARIPGSASLDRENTPGERRGWIGVDVGPLGQATRSRAVIPLLVLALRRLQRRDQRLLLELLHGRHTATLVGADYGKLPCAGSGAGRQLVSRGAERSSSSYQGE